MNRFHISATILRGALIAVSISPVLRADAWNKKTVVDFPAPVEVPGAVLQPGKYVFKLMDSTADRHIVQIASERGDHVYSTILAIPNYRVEPADKTIFTFYEMPTGQPEALRAWFYPGDNFGQEFAYPDHRATQISQTTGLNVPTSSPQAAITEPPANEPPATPAAENSKSEAAPTEMAMAAPAPAEPAKPEPMEANSQPTAEPASSPENPSGKGSAIPKTASNTPFILLLGFLSLGGAAGARFIKRSA